MISIGPDGALVVEDEVVEVIDWDGVVELGVGATGWIHAGVVVDVQPGAVAYLAAGAHQDPVRLGDLERGEITVAAWPAQRPAPCGARTIAPPPVATHTSKTVPPGLVTVREDGAA